MSIRFRVPPPPHGITWYPHAIWRSKTCQFGLGCPLPPMAKQGTHTPYGAQKHVNSIWRSPLWHNMVPTPHMEDKNTPIQFRVPPPPPHGKTRYPHPIWAAEACHFNFAPPPWQIMVPTPLTKVKNMSIQFCVPPPIATQGTHTTYGAHKHANSISRAPLPLHGKTRYPHPIWRSETCQFIFVCPLHGITWSPHPIWRSGTCQFNFTCPPPLWQNKVPTPHMDVTNMSLRFGLPPSWHNLVPIPHMQVRTMSI